MIELPLVFLGGLLGSAHCLGMCGGFAVLIGGAAPRWARFVLPAVVISLLVGVAGIVGYRYLSEEIRRETHRTLAVIAEQKRQQIEASLVDTGTDAELFFSRHTQIETLFGDWLRDCFDPTSERH